MYKNIGAPSAFYKETIVMNADLATLPLTAASTADGSFLHVIDTGVFGRFYANGTANGHYYDMSTGAVII